MYPDRVQLFEFREGRIHPHKDDKILTSWNGLMIAALSRGAKAFGKSAYAEAAAYAVTFIRENLVRADGRLLVRLKETYDGALPSGNGVAACQLKRLWQLTGRELFREWATGTVEALSGAAGRYPSGHSLLLTAGMAMQTGGQDIVITGRRDDAAVNELIHTAQQI